MFFKRLFVMDASKSRFEFFQLSQTQKKPAKTNPEYRGN